MASAALLIAAFAGLPVVAQTDADATAADASDAAEVSDTATDPPSRAARLSYIEGSASLQPAGIDDWNSAPLNQPLTVGDALWIDGGSRAEIDLGTALIRLDERSSIALLDLNDRTTQLRLSGGSIDITVNALDSGELFEIDAPNSAFALLRPGEYRIGVDTAGNTSIVIRAGQAQAQSGDDQAISLTTGQRGLFAASGSYALTQAGAPDEFDHWCQQRQARWAQDQAVARYVSTDVVGYQDLQEYGQWQQQPDYGYVWIPQVADDWAPYTAGHWIWVEPWGWTWVDDAPWGYAPFHYGRWAHLGRRWCWVPAPPHRRAIYAPALVAWVGGPHRGGSIALGGGAAVGWLPLAPGEVFVPAYRVTPRYLQNVNMYNTTGLNPGYITNVARNPALQNRYANRDFDLTVVPQSNFTAGQPVQRHRISAPPQFQSAQPTPRVPGIVPGHESVLGAFSLGRIASPPQNVLQRSVTVHRPLPPTLPSFDQQRAAIQANGGRPLDAAQLQSLRGPLPARIAMPTAVTSPSAAMPGNANRGIPERSPQFQAPPQQHQPPPQASDQNVFRQRDRELQQQRDAELRAQAQEQQRRQRQQSQQQQQSLQQHRGSQAQTPQVESSQIQAPQIQAPRTTAPPPASPPPPPVQHLQPQVRRPSGPSTPTEQR